MTNKEYVIPEVKKTLNDENFKIWRDELHTNFVKKIGEMERKDGSLGIRIGKLNIAVDRHMAIQKVHTKMLTNILKNSKDESDMYVSEIDEINRKYDEKLRNY